MLTYVNTIILQLPAALFFKPPSAKRCDGGREMRERGTSRLCVT
jgi:hypothetical protein